MNALETYYATLDAGDLDGAVAMLARDVRFAMMLPTGTRRGAGRDAMLDYLRARPDVDRRHRLLRVAHHDDVVFAHGAVTENGTTTTGFFVGVMHIDVDGRIDRYQVSFDPEFGVLPEGADNTGVSA